MKVSAGHPIQIPGVLEKLRLPFGVNNIDSKDIYIVFDQLSNGDMAPWCFIDRKSIGITKLLLEVVKFSNGSHIWINHSCDFADFYRLDIGGGYRIPKPIGFDLSVCYSLEDILNPSITEVRRFEFGGVLYKTREEAVTARFASDVKTLFNKEQLKFMAENAVRLKQFLESK